MNRWKAFGIHLALTALLLGAFAGVMIGVWYGWELFNATKGAKLLALAAGSALLVGPLLTLLVYKPGKPSLRFDLAVIVLLQLALLGYGVFIAAQSRPVFMVGLVDRFELVFANDLDDADLAEATEAHYRVRGWSGPLLVGGLLGQNSKERFELSMLGWNGKDIHLLPKRYADYGRVEEALRAKAEPARKLAESSDAARRRLEQAASAHGVDLDQLQTLPIVSRRGRATMLLDRDTGKLYGPVNVEPWPDMAGQE